MGTSWNRKENSKLKGEKQKKKNEFTNENDNNWLMELKLKKKRDRKDQSQLIKKKCLEIEAEKATDWRVPSHRWSVPVGGFVWRSLRLWRAIDWPEFPVRLLACDVLCSTLPVFPANFQRAKSTNSTNQCNTKQISKAIDGRSMAARFLFLLFSNPFQVIPPT